MEERIITINRTPEQIAAEINFIGEEAKKQVIHASIEIGRRLTEAKSMLNHGEWGKWLEEKVNYSKSTANNLMKIFHEYGENQIPGNDTKSQAIGKLSYTQAIALLSIKDSEERVNFIENNNIDEMSTRELKKAIDEKNKAEEEKNAMEKKLIEYKNKSKEDQEKIKIIEIEKNRIYEELSKTSNKLLSDLNNKENDMLHARKEVEELKNKIKLLEKRPVEVITGTDEKEIKVLEEKHKKEIESLIIQKLEAEKMVESLENKIKDNSNDNKKYTDENLVKFEIHFNELISNFKTILSDVAEIDEDQEKYKKAVRSLINKMLETM